MMTKAIALLLASACTVAAPYETHTALCGDDVGGEPDASIPDAAPPVDAPPFTCETAPPAAYVDPTGLHAAVTMQRATTALCGTPPRPLVLVLGGYSASNSYYFQTAMGLRHLYNVPPVGAFVLAPDGAVQPGTTRQHYWNADPGCCDKLAVGNDDVAYLRGLITWAMTHYNVDHGRVFVVGMSNGGFLAERMRCEAPDLVTAIVDLAGQGRSPGTPTCAPSPPVSALVDHSIGDTTIRYDGGHFAQMPVGANHIGTLATIAQNATTTGCSALALVTANAFDHDANVAGAETDRLTMTCPGGAAVEHWREPTSAHGFAQTANATPTGPTSTVWADHAWAWLSSHPR